MNFISTFDELNKLYEEATPKAEQEKKVEAPLTEAAEDEEIEIIDDDEGVVEEIPAEEAPVEEPVVEDEPKQLILECDKCGALVLKNEVDIVADEESGLINIEDECQFCEEAKGFKIVGVVAPYEVAEEAPVDEASEEPVEEEEISEGVTEPVVDDKEEVHRTKDDEELEELFDIKPSISLGLHGGSGNDVSVLGH